MKPPLQDPSIPKVVLKVVSLCPSKTLVKAKQNTTQCKRPPPLINWYSLDV